MAHNQPIERTAVEYMIETVGKLGPIDRSPRIEENGSVRSNHKVWRHVGVGIASKTGRRIGSAREGCAKYAASLPPHTAGDLAREGRLRQHEIQRATIVLGAVARGEGICS